MRVLIIGSGAREHAILQSVANSSGVKKIYCAPGNAGMLSAAECIDIAVDDLEALKDFAVSHAIDLTIVGPELPLTLGIIDTFEQKGLKIFGPNKRASLLEGSKIFTKEFCQRHHIPTANFQVFTHLKEAKNYVVGLSDFPVVIKADGLASGKGVFIAKDKAQAIEAVEQLMEQNRFGQAGHKIIVEDFIQGQEASFIVVADGLDYIEFLPSQDHKRLLDGDQGPNTGGMGAYAPAPLITEKYKQQIKEQIIQPTLKGMQDEGRTYTGFLYAGLMIGNDGKLSLLEYNCRLGDPESQVILPLLKSDFVQLLRQAVDHQLNSYQPEYDSGSAVCVVLASEGYPGDYQKGKTIKGLSHNGPEDTFIYHAGTKQAQDKIVTNGGRVLTVSARAANLSQAIKKAYEQVDQIHWDGMSYRKDIAQKGLKLETV